MGKVYLIYGYSDHDRRDVIGVCSTKKLAEHEVSRRRGLDYWSDVGYEEAPVDMLCGEEWGPVYHVWLKIETAEIDRRCDGLKWRHPGLLEVAAHRSWIDPMVVATSATSYEHAERMARGRLEVLKLEKQGASSGR